MELQQDLMRGSKHGLGVFTGCMFVRLAGLMPGLKAFGLCPRHIRLFWFFKTSPCIDTCHMCVQALQRKSLPLLMLLRDRYQVTATYRTSFADVWPPAFSVGCLL